MLDSNRPDTPAGATGQRPIYRQIERPEWVEDRTPASVVDAAAESPRTCLLVDYQTRVNDRGIWFYTRIVTEILDASCIEDLSQWLYELEPDSQHLELHHCRVLRGDTTIDALDEENIRVLQRDQRLESHISSDRLTVELTIDDLRVGDILDIATTEVEHHGAHPVLGRFLRNYNWLSWSIPVYSQHIRVLNQHDIPIVVRELDSANQVDERQILKAGATYDHHWTNLPISSRQVMLPDEYWPHCLMMTTQADWPDVAQHLSSFYAEQGASKDGLELADLAGDVPQLQNGVVSDESLLALIRFVQNNIRYRSESSGIYSHTPRPPSKTFKKRAGDCKDKSNLLVHLLRKLGVQADLALVNTQLQSAVVSLDPSPMLFNHMIVSFVWQKKRYWLDATQQKQAGDLSHMAMLDYQQALLLGGPKAGLIKLPFHRDDLVFRLHQNFDLARTDQQGPQVEVLREYHGARADNMRYYIASTESSVLQERFQSYSSEEVDVKLSPLDAFSVYEDDKVRNILITRECYSVETPIADLDGQRFRVGTHFFGQIYDPPSEHHPMQMDMDGVMEHKIRIRYANKPAAEAEEYEKSSRWFKYSDDVQLEDKELRFNMRYEPLDPIVAVADQKQYLDDVSEIRKRSSSGFAAIVESHQSFAEIFILLIVLLFCGILLMFQDRLPLPVTLSLAAATIALSFHEKLGKLWRRDRSQDG